MLTFHAQNASLSGSLAHSTARGVGHRRPVKVWDHPRSTRAIYKLLSVANAESLLAMRSITLLQRYPGIAFKAWDEECCVLAVGWSDFE
jgi:hypothetical protein